MGNYPSKLRIGTLARCLAMAIAITTGASVPLAVAYAQSQKGEAVQFNIPAGDLAGALDRFAEQSGLQVVSDQPLVKGLKASALSGRHRPADALKALLRGTNLEYSFVNDSTVVLKRASVPAKTPPRNVPGNSTPKDARGEATRELEKVVVTGTSIRADMLDEGPSPVLQFSRETIERSGRSSVPDFLKTLPQNFASATISGADTASLTPNPGGASAPSLRGLGAGSTLTLLNGRRLPAASGSLGFLSDISIIPIAAIDHIEVLPDSASAIYGSDAVSGVVNVILRKDYEGAEIGASYGRATEGGYDRWQVSAVAGTRWKSGSLLVGMDASREDMLESMKRDFSRTDDLRSKGGTDRRSTLSSPGNIMGFVGGAPPGITTPVPIPPGQNGTNLTATDLLSQVGRPINRTDNAATVSTLLPRQERTTAFLSVRQDLTDWLSFNLDGYVAERDTEQSVTYSSSIFVVPASNAFNRFGRTVQVGYALTELGPVIGSQEIRTYSVTGTFEAYFGDWRAQASYGRAGDHTDALTTNEIDRSRLSAALASSNPLIALNVFGDGSANTAAVLDSISFDRSTKRKTGMDVARLVFDGPIATLPGGELKVALGAEYRDEWYDFDAAGSGSSLSRIRGQADRIAKATFAEILLPIYGEENARPGLQRLDLTLAGRADDYSDFGRADTPKVGLVWKPNDWLLLRGTYSKAFQAPPIESARQSELPLIVSVDGGFPDPARNGQSTPVQLLLGGGKELRPQKADTWTYGFVLQPMPKDPTFRLSLDYFRIEYVDRVATYDPSEIARDPATYADFQTRAALTPADQAAGFKYGRLQSIDLRATNAAQTEVAGWDFRGEYRLPSMSIGKLTAQASLTHYDYYRNKPTATGSVFDRRGLLGYPPRYIANAGLSWERGNFSIDTFVRRTDGYRDTNFRTDDGKIDAYTTCDIGFSYRRESLVTSLNVINVFREDPSFVNRSGAYDPNVADARGRTVTVSFRKSF